MPLHINTESPFLQIRSINIIHIFATIQAYESPYCVFAPPLPPNSPSLQRATSGGSDADVVGTAMCLLWVAW